MEFRNRLRVLDIRFAGVFSDMDVLPYVLVGLIALGLLLTFTFIRNGNSGEMNYRGFFFIGLAFLPVGVTLFVATRNPGLIGISGVGAAYLVIGLSNRDKWE
jgi:hypothetical protein